MYRQTSVFMPSRSQNVKTPGEASDSQLIESSMTVASEDLEDVTVVEPLFLRRWTLIAVAIFFLALASSIFLISNIANKQNGFEIITTNHYYWTYGPTAVLVIVVAAWRQIDFACKALVPWRELQSGPADASNTVLLDYISPLHIISFSKAVKNRHYTIIASIAGFGILKFVTLASTGLLVEQAGFNQPQNTTILRTSQFVAPDLSQTPALGLFDPSIAYTTFAVTAKGLPYPEGTTADFAFQTYALPENLQLTNTTVNVNGQAFVPDYSCQAIPFSVNLQPANSTTQHPSDTILLSNAGCTLRPGASAIYTLNPQISICPPRQLSPLFQSIDCITSNSQQTEEWQLLTLADISYSQVGVRVVNPNAIPPLVQATNWSTSIQQTTGIICQARYSIRPLQITYEYTNGQQLIKTELLNGTSTNQLGNLTNQGFAGIIDAALTAASNMFGDVLNYDSFEDYPQTLFKLMSIISGGTYEALLNSSVMVESAEKILNQLAIQAAHKYILAQDSTKVQAQSQPRQDRLQLSNVSYWVMLLGCIVLAVLAVAILLLRPHGTGCLDAWNPGRTAALLARSPEFGRLLQGCVAQKENDFATAVGCYRFSIRTPNNNTNWRQIILRPIKDQEDETASRMDSTYVNTSKVQPCWWQPLTLRRPVLALCLVMPMVSVVVLEILQRRSDLSNGFVTVSSDLNSLSRYTRLIPALYMLLVATLVNALEFNISLLTPFDNLFRGPTQARTGILLSIIGHPPPAVLFTALRYRRWGGASSTMAALLASILTIVVSGLFTLNSVPTTNYTSIHVLDQFNTTWQNSVLQDNGAAIVASLSESLNLTYPMFTHDELALSTCQIDDSNNTSDLAPNASFEAHIPSLRASLECSTLRSDTSFVNVSADYNFHTDSSRATVTVYSSLPPSCQRGGRGGNQSFIDLTHSFPLDGNASYVGKMLDLHVGPWTGLAADSADELAATTQGDNPPGCPSLTFMYGYANVNNVSDNEITVLICYQYLDGMSTNATFLASDLSIDTRYPPQPDEQSTTRLKSSQSGETAFQYRLQLHIDNEFSSFNQTDPDFSVSGTAPPLDNFFQGVLYGRKPIAESTLTGPANQEQVFNGIQGLYRRYMAQAISANMRMPLANFTTSTGTSNDSNMQNVTVSNAGQTVRIMQNKNSKIILQCLLGAIFVLSAMALKLTKVHQLVPQNPCCIAGMASLFAGSDMCDPSSEMCQLLFPSGVEVMTDKELDRMWKDWRFQLGWWGQRYGIEATRTAEVL